MISKERIRSLYINQKTHNKCTATKMSPDKVLLNLELVNKSVVGIVKPSLFV